MTAECWGCGHDHDNNDRVCQQCALAALTTPTADRDQREGGGQ